MKTIILRLLLLALMSALVLPCFAVTLSAAGADKKSRSGERQNITHVKGSNTASASYMEGKYYSQLTSLPYTEDNVTDLIAVALSQLGYMESNSVNDMSGTTGGNDNYTEYNYNMGNFGVGYGTKNYDWCASFVSFCLLQSRCTDQDALSDWCRNHMGDAEYIWREVGCPKWAENLDKTGYYRDSAANGGEYIPKTGDLIFFRWSPEKAIGHIGIVVYCDGERVYTVEGNTSGGTTMVANGGAVHFKNYALDYSCIDGYGDMPYAENTEAEKIDYTGNNPTVGRYVSTTEKKIYFEPSVEGLYLTLPEYTVFDVIEVVEGGLGGMLKMVCEVDGKTLAGYVVNDSTERVIQITSGIAPQEPISFLPYYATDGFVGGEIKAYAVNGEKINEGDEIIIAKSGTIAVEGFFGFESPIRRLGFFIDSDRENISWINGGILEPSEEMEQIAGENALKCEIVAPIEKLTYGSYNVTFVIELENDVITIVDTLAFKVKSKDTEHSTEAPTDGADATEPPSDAADAPEDQTQLPSQEGSEGASETADSGEASEPSGSGCASSVGAGASASLFASAAAFIFGRRRRKKED